jgi:hypothetical protein
MSGTYNVKCESVLSGAIDIDVAARKVLLDGEDMLFRCAFCF